MLRIVVRAMGHGLYGGSVVKAALEMMEEVCGASDEFNCTLRLTITLINCVDELSLGGKHNMTCFGRGNFIESKRRGKFPS